MFCPNCGQQLPDDSTFCESCGARIEPETEETQPVPQGQAGRATTPKTGGSTEKITNFVKKNGKLLGIAAGGIAVVVAVVVFLVTRPLSISLDAYLTVEFSGYDTIGTAAFHFDEESFCADYADKISYEGEEPLGELVSGEVACEILVQDCIDGELSEVSELSNGDTVVFTWDCDDATAERDFGVRLDYEDVSIQVIGLEAADVVDPFEDVELVVDGIAPFGEATLVNHSSAPYAGDIPFEMDTYENLDNGATVTVSIPQVDSDAMRTYYLQNYGISFSQTEKTYPVEGLTTYLKSLSEIPADAMQEMQARGEDAIRAEAAQDWGENVTLTAASCLGSILLTAKDMDDGSVNNLIYLVYQIESSVTVQEETEATEDAPAVTTERQEPVTYFYTVMFDNLLLNADGTVQVDFGDYDVPSERFTREIGGSRYRFRGFEDLDAMFRECVTVNIDRYAYESSVTAA